MHKCFGLYQRCDPVLYDTVVDVIATTHPSQWQLDRRFGGVARSIVVNLTLRDSPIHWHGGKYILAEDDQGKLELVEV